VVFCFFSVTSEVFARKVKQQNITKPNCAHLSDPNRRLIGSCYERKIANAMGLKRITTPQQTNPVTTLPTNQPPTNPPIKTQTKSRDCKIYQEISAIVLSLQT
jgi:hypothetical protein